MSSATRPRPRTTELANQTAEPLTPAEGVGLQSDSLLSWAGILKAQRVIAEVLPPTPAWSYPLLDAAVGGRVVLKHENTQPTGAFKVRGGLSLAATLGADVAALVTASTGNHAQSIAFAARHRGLDCLVVMPTTAPPNKIAATEALGARVVIHGPTMTEAVAHARELAEAKRWRYVDPGGEPAIVHGHATVYLELLASHPDLEAIYVPVGSGTGAAGACLVRDRLAPSCRVVGVQSAQAPAAFESWRAGAPRSAPCTTNASGLATATPFELPQAVLRERLDEFLLVDDQAIDGARGLLARHAHTLAEGAGAAALAGLLADPARPGFCAVVVTGGNADERELATLALG